MRELFSQDEVVYFSTAHDCEEKARYYLAHLDEAAVIAKAGQKRAHKDYEAQMITSEMLRKLLA